MTNPNINHLYRVVWKWIYLWQHMRRSNILHVGSWNDLKILTGNKIYHNAKKSLHSKRLIWKQKDSGCFVTMGPPGSYPGITTAQPYQRHRNGLFWQRVAAGWGVVPINLHCALMSSFWILPRFKQWWRDPGTGRKCGSWRMLQGWGWFAFVFLGNHVMII